MHKFIHEFGHTGPRIKRSDPPELWMYERSRQEISANETVITVGYAKFWPQFCPVINVVKGRDP